MKTMILLLASSILLVGCASFEEAYYVDREFGQRAQETWDMQVAYPDYRYAVDQTTGEFRNPETLEGLPAENVMEVYTDTFADAPTDANVIEFNLTD
jgi:hypothetical protein